ncbi:MAG: hypothetical protein GY719_34800 [bacterium]|nr:hypothetical protein [bacterium]
MSRHLEKKRLIRLLVLAALAVSFFFVAASLPMSSGELSVFTAISAVFALFTIGAFGAYVYDENRFRWGLLCAGVSGAVHISMFLVRDLSRPAGSDDASSNWSTAMDLGESIFLFALCVIAAVVGWEKLKAGKSDS